MDHGIIIKSFRVLFINLIVEEDYYIDIIILNKIKQLGRYYSYWYTFQKRKKKIWNKYVSINPQYIFSRCS